MDGGKISVIVPCYNIENYIEDTVQSILKQTYRNLEILLVDDGSTDNTSAIIDRLAHENMCVWAFHKENGGVSSARLYGVVHSEGVWISFVDGDDLLKPEMYAVLVDNALEYKADISHCGYEMVFPDHIDRYYGSGKHVLQNHFEGLRDLLSGDFVEPGLWNKLYRRELVIRSLDDCELHHEIRNMEDLLWNYYFFRRAGKSVYVDNCYYQYVLRSGSAATSKLNRHKVLDPLRVFRLIEQDIENSDELVCIVRGRLAASLIVLATMDTAVNPKWARKCAKRAKAVLRADRLHYLRGKYSLKLKLQLLLVSASPGIYMCVHRVYSKLKGTDHKYDI